MNHAPIATNASYSTNKNTSSPSLYGLLADCTDADSDTLHYRSRERTRPSGTLSLDGNGSFTYTPTTGYSGADSFTYKANDGTTDSNVATVSLTIVNHAPVATDASYSTNKNTRSRSLLPVSLPTALTRTVTALPPLS